MHIFYTPDVSTKFYRLNETESKHCVKVLRLNKNDNIKLIDGKGGFYKAKIIDNHAKRCVVEIIESQKEYGKRCYYLHIAIAPTKNIDRLEWFLEKATEIGIDEITPIICARSERKIIKPERLIKIVSAAVKQSIKAYHPILNPVIKFSEFVKTNINGEKYIAHCHETKKQNLKEIYRAKQRATILIGPEGDFNEEEIEFALQNDFTEITLGNSRLRTETAGIVASHTISLLNLH